MAKNTVNTNFENLKAEMIRKKEIAKDVVDNETSNTNNNVNNCKDVNNNVNIDVSNTSNTNISQNKIVIKKASKPQPPKRITYYLNQDTIKKIEKYSKLTGMGKSELVQTLLDISLNNLEIK
ncbi:MAG: hypothetical protein RSG52_14640 [Terrisporobacter sp.]|uniref:hypothetical protein n=1 Tax=Terrisporobacter sp. TaxID=1965305 RepID=UPI002FC8ED1B